MTPKAGQSNLPQKGEIKRLLKLHLKTAGGIISRKGANCLPQSRKALPRFEGFLCAFAPDSATLRENPYL